jgi:hypothetical protein
LDVEVSIREENGSSFYMLPIKTQALRSHQTHKTNGPHMDYAFVPCIMPLNNEESEYADHEKYFKMNDRFNYLIGSKTCWNVSRIRVSDDQNYPENDKYRNFLYKTDLLNGGAVPLHYQPYSYFNKTLSIICKASLGKIVSSDASVEVIEAVYFPPYPKPGYKEVIMETKPYKFTTKAQ